MDEYMYFVDGVLLELGFFLHFGVLKFYRVYVYFKVTVFTLEFDMDCDFNRYIKIDYTYLIFNQFQNGDFIYLNLMFASQ